ncbi:Uncharacterised protein r2_g3907 [Pycnogonum litorale]
MYCVGADLKRLIEAHKCKQETYDDVINAIRVRFSSPSSQAFNRYKLAEMSQFAGESTSDFISRLRAHVRFCGFVCSSCDASYEDERLFEVVLKNTSLPQLRVKVFEKGCTVKLRYSVPGLKRTHQYNGQISKSRFSPMHKPINGVRLQHTPL